MQWYNLHNFNDVGGAGVNRCIMEIIKGCWSVNAVVFSRPVKKVIETVVTLEEKRQWRMQKHEKKKKKITSQSGDT